MAIILIYDLTKTSTYTKVNQARKKLFSTTSSVYIEVSNNKCNCSWAACWVSCLLRCLCLESSTCSRPCGYFSKQLGKTHKFIGHSLSCKRMYWKLAYLYLTHLPAMYINPWMKCDPMVTKINLCSVLQDTVYLSITYY